MKDNIYRIDDKETKSILYLPRFNEYGIPCQEDGVSMLHIEYCPWCGKKLPDSYREKWFDELLLLGFEDPIFDESIPEKYKSDKWWNKNIQAP